MLLMLGGLAFWRALTRYMATPDRECAFWLMFFSATLMSCLSESLIPAPGFLTLLAGIGVVQLATDPDQQPGRLYRSALN